MHNFQRRMLLCEQSGWEPLKKNHVKKTTVVHTPACGLNHRRTWCDCAGQILVTLKDGRKFEIDADGKAFELKRMA